MAAKSGVYCGPLKLLAAEVFQKTNASVSLSIILTFILIQLKFHSHDYCNIQIFVYLNIN